MAGSQSGRAIRDCCKKQVVGTVGAASAAILDLSFTIKTTTYGIRIAAEAAPTARAIYFATPSSAAIRVSFRFDFIEQSDQGSRLKPLLSNRIVSS